MTNREVRDARGPDDPRDPRDVRGPGDPRDPRDDWEFGDPQEEPAFGNVEPIPRRRVRATTWALVASLLVSLALGWLAAMQFANKDAEILNAACSNYDTLHTLITDTPETPDEVLMALGFNERQIEQLRESTALARATQLEILGERPAC